MRWRSLLRLVKPFGIAIVEDASHAVGACYQQQPVGNCRFSDVAVFSFHPVKIITTGEGGAITTREAALAARMARLRSHGITKDPAEFELEPAGPWSYANSRSWVSITDSPTYRRPWV